MDKNKLLLVVGLMAPLLLVGVLSNQYASSPSYNFADDIGGGNVIINDIISELAALEKSKEKFDMKSLESAPESFLTGELKVFHFDNFEEQKSSFNYYLKPDGGRGLVELVLPDQKEGFEGLMSGSKITARVKLKDNIGQVSSYEIQSRAQTGHTVKKVAVIMFNLQNDLRIPATESVARNAVFTRSTSLNNFYQETSFGNVSVIGFLRSDGDIFGTYTLPYNNSPCDIYTWANTANDLAAQDSFVKENYNNVIYLFPNTSVCKWSGMAEVGGSLAYSWINGSSNITNFVVKHEFGHNLGLAHASSYSCAENSVKVTIGGKCTIGEYGDPFDVMGLVSRHHNNFEKGRANWYQESNVLDVNSSGVYEVYPVEKINSGVQSLRVPRNKDSLGNVTQYLYIEYRQPFGIDSFLTTDPVVNGITLRLGPSFGVIDRSLLLDTTPGTTSFKDSPLLLGKKLDDLKGGISIETVGIDTNRATVNIDLTCQHFIPSLSVSPTVRFGSPGQNLSYLISVLNNDSLWCAGSTFTTTANLPSGWTQTPTSQSFNLLPKSDKVLNINMVSPAEAIPATYIIPQHISVDSGTDHLFDSVVNLYYVIPVGGLATYNITTPFKKDAEVNIQWTTDEASDSQVEYGVTTNYGTLSPLITNKIKTHTVKILNLIPNTTYHYRVKSKTAAGKSGQSSDLTFTTEVAAPPIISNVKSSVVVEDGATISWSTDESSDTQVEYGLTTSYGQQSALNSVKSLTHSVKLSSLGADTLYHYRVKSKDSAGNLATSGDYTFTTTASAPPVISNVKASAITEIAATISWSTNEVSDTQVEYGTTIDYGQQSVLNTSKVTSHNVKLAGFNPETSYHYRVKSKDSAGNLAISGDYTFTTTPQQPPIISAVKATGITETVAKITWTTNESADTQVEYGLTTDYGLQSVLNTSQVTAHFVNLSGLTANTLYHYRVKSKDPSGNEAISANYTFSTIKFVSL